MKLVYVICECCGAEFVVTVPGHVTWRSCPECFWIHLVTVKEGANA